MIARAVLALIAVVTPAAVRAQAYRCSAPAGIDQLRADLPSASQPKRLLPIGGYTLAITWASQYCHDHADEPSARFQCRSGNRFGFALHGLWPDGVGKDWPQYCRATPLLPRAVVQRHLCTTPSAQLMQHEWAKHGTCMPGYRPQSYFARSNGLYAQLRYPNMDTLSRAPLTAGRLAQAIAGVNAGLGADMMRVTANKQGWLDEIWICLDTRFHYQRCPAHQGGLAPGAAIKLWRGPR